MSISNGDFLKGRGAQFNLKNRFEKREYTFENIELPDDEPFIADSKTEYLQTHPKTIINEVDSPDLGMVYSMNPYQGCEHGCIYCYARNSHQYWGYSPGLEFEQKILIKENAPALLRKAFDHKKWQPKTIMLAGNTDCYQPIERKKQITRKMLEVCLEYKHPVSIITKNSLVIRDIDILTELAKLNLVHVNVSVTTLDEELRLKMEPRTTTGKQRLKIIEKLSEKDIPVNVMAAPIIPGLNDHEIPQIIKAAAEKGATSAAYTIVRLNGAVAEIFEDWIHKAYPDRAEKVLSQIADCHGGKLNDSRWGTRMRGEGNIARAIGDLFKMSKLKYLKGKVHRPYDFTQFRRPQRGQLSLFE